MIDFQTPKLSDKNWVDQILRLSPQRASDYNFANLFMWGPTVQARIARLGQRLAVHVKHPTPHAYLWPVGGGDVKDALMALKADAEEWGKPLHLVAITSEQKEQLQDLFPGRFRFIESRGDFDYLYHIDKLSDLAGRKLHAKRNHISRFIKDNPTWVYEELKPENLDECLVMDEQWYLRSTAGERALKERDTEGEGQALHRAAQNFTALGLEGGLLRVYGEVIAFTIGTPLSGDTYDVHYEKAYGELQGAYAMINRSFARQVRERHPQIVYMNRENDLGVAGLRKAKESYYTDLMVEKYGAIEI